MRKKLTPHMKYIARKFVFVEGAPLESFRRMLANMISNRGSLTLAAKALEIDVSTLSRWCTELDIELRTTRTTVAHTALPTPYII